MMVIKMQNIHSVITINPPDIYANTTPPQNPKLGTIWFDTSTNPATPKYFNGREWVEFQLQSTTQSTSTTPTSTPRSILDVASDPNTLLKSLIWS